MKYKRNTKATNKFIRDLKLRHNVKTRLTTKRLYKGYQEYIKKAPSDLKDYLKKVRESYGFSEINENILNNKKISAKEKRFLVSREIGLLTGEYQNFRKNQFIANYSKALRDMGLSSKKIKYIDQFLYTLSPSELALHIKAGTLPNAFIPYKYDASDTDIMGLEEDIDNFIENLTDLSNDNDDIGFKDIE